MIKNELRIGNWVSYGEHPRQITMLSATTQKVGIDAIISLLEVIEPIPLTFEILEKCGFVKDETKVGDWVNGNYRLRERVGAYSLYRDYENEDIADYFADVKLIHQLQNLYFALTGEELNVQL